MPRLLEDEKLISQRRRHGVAALALVVVGSFLTIDGCQQRQETPTYSRPRSPAGKFDYFVLALSWAPAFCAHETDGRNSRECDARTPRGFVVHGLWPQTDSGHSLEYCENVSPIPHAIVEGMLEVMPDRSLIQHEWRAHGSCSGLSAAEYFRTVRRVFSKVQIPNEFRSARRRINMSPPDIERKFAAANNFADIPAVRVGCRQGEFSEIRLCLSKDLQPIPCGANVHECPEARVFVRPVSN